MEHGIFDMEEPYVDTKEITEENKQVAPVPISPELQAQANKIMNQQTAVSFINKNKYVTNAAIIGAVAGLVFGFATKRNLFMSALVGGAGLGFLTSLIKKD